MIEFANKEDTEQIKKLWKNVFADSDEYIKRYLNEFLPYVCVYKENRFIKGMVSLIPITMNEKCGRYVYAAATEEKSRGKGIATKLLEYASKFIKQKGEDFLVLVPAEKSLFDFYKKRGYRAVSPLKIIECDDISSGSTHLEAKKILPKKLSELRGKFIKKEDFIAWGEKELEYIWKIYDGNFFYITGDEGEGFCVCSYYGGLLDVKEIWCDKIDYKDAVAAVNKFFNASHFRIALPQKGEPYAMILGDKSKKIYFNLGMD